jgi:N5-methyltetrahydromethanopterin:coenzyme M methyltransferase subunit H
MLDFKTPQKTFIIGGVKVGGPLGVNPTVMIGSIFYKNDPLITNARTGEFDRSEANKLIKKVEDASNSYGLPFMLDIVCSVDDAVEDYFAWAIDSTDVPLLIDAVSNEAALKGLQYAKDQDILDRVIFNSLNEATSNKIFDKIREVGLKSAILLTYSNKAVTSSTKRVKIFKTILKRARSVGISKPLVDTFVMDVPTLGLASKAFLEIKDKYGLPVGYGAHNAIGAWKQLKRQKNKQITTACTTIVNSFPAVLGADFIIYGPLRMADHLFPAVSIVDTAHAQVALEKKKRLDRVHPRYKLASSINITKKVSEPKIPRDDELEELRIAIRTYEADQAALAVEKLLGKGISPIYIIEEGLTKELREIGEEFGKGNIWFTDLVSAAETVEASMKVIEPEIQKTQEKKTTLGKYLIGTVYGDIHDIGKNILALLLRANGFEVIDLGVNVETDEFVEAVREHTPDILGMSALLTTTLKELRKVVNALEKEGLRKNINIIIGGAATSKELASELGVDAYAESAIDGVRIGKELIRKC